MEIRLVEPLATAAKLVAPVLLERLDAYAADPERNPVALEGLRLRIPVALEVGERIGIPPDGARVRISAVHESRLFPIFTGTIRVERQDALTSRLELKGSYAPPLGPIGALVDQTVFADVAADSLRRFLAHLKSDVAAATLRRELGISPPSP
ncbi:MAG TPA: hypothetical protein VE591_01570 [Candidatus Acidoferrum sp.]|nr:hypothetical protein [Candidatus Acidoferrum sp.]